jgi:membrane-associated phospholipid phosphatase
MLPVLQYVAIIMTGNHYFIDTIVGVAMAIICLLLYELYLRHRRRRHPA